MATGSSAARERRHERRASAGVRGKVPCRGGGERTQRIIRWAKKSGDECARVVRAGGERALFSRVFTTQRAKPSVRSAAR